MQISVTDTVSISSSDTIQKDTLVREYYLGKIIPVDSIGKAFPDTITSSDGSMAKAYTEYTRVKGDPKGGSSFNTDYAFGLLSFSLFMFALLSLTGRKHVVNIISSLSIKKPFVLKSQAGIGVFSWAPLFVNLSSIINTSLFVVAAAVKMDLFGPLPGFESVKIISFAIAGLAAAIILRHLTCLIVGSVSGQKAAFREYLSVITATWFISGFVFFCVSFLILFTQIAYPEILILGALSVFALLYFYRIIRLLIIFMRQSVTILYF
ncbi:MAG TPA: DUF4271 domain-containing protein, partial [Bacteroidales bacterium]|nr:DUF4271 domain-containing protein [Bacteroidales bacterium]